MPKLKKSYLVGLLLLVLVYFFLLSSNLSVFSNNRQPTQKLTTASLGLDYGTGKIDEGFKNVSFTKGQTAMDLTAKMVKVEISATGTVTAINSRTADANQGQFWKVLVNGQESEGGAESVILHDGDNIEWKLIKY